MNEPVIREARAEDVARIVTLILLGAATQTKTREEIEAEAALPAYRTAFAEIAADPGSTVFVAESAGEVVGTFQLTIIPGLVRRGQKRAKIESVHVAPELRGRKIGAAMIAHALAEAQRRGAGLAELSSDKSRDDAHRFYRNLGFAQSHEGFKKPL